MWRDCVEWREVLESSTYSSSRCEAFNTIMGLLAATRTHSFIADYELANKTSRSSTTMFTFTFLSSIFRPLYFLHKWPSFPKFQEETFQDLTDLDLLLLHNVNCARSLYRPLQPRASGSSLMSMPLPIPSCEHPRLELGLTHQWTWAFQNW